MQHTKCPVGGINNILNVSVFAAGSCSNPATESRKEKDSTLTRNVALSASTTFDLVQHQHHHPDCRLLAKWANNKHSTLATRLQRLESQMTANDEVPIEALHTWPTRPGIIILSASAGTTNRFNRLYCSRTDNNNSKSSKVLPRSERRLCQHLIGAQREKFQSTTTTLIGLSCLACLLLLVVITTAK